MAEVHTHECHKGQTSNIKTAKTRTSHLKMTPYVVFGIYVINKINELGQVVHTRYDQVVHARAGKYINK